MPGSKPLSKHSEYDTLLQQYLAVCNQVLEANRDRFPYKQIWASAEQFAGDRMVQVAIYDDRLKGCCRMRMKDGRIDADDACASTGKATEAVLKVSVMEDVVAHPEEYINDPSRIDWSWLKPEEN